MKFKNKISQKRAFFAISKLSLLGMIKNPTFLFFNFAFPLLLIAIFGMLGSGEQKFELGILENSIKEGEIYDNLKKIENVILVEDKTDEEFQIMLEKGQIPATLSINEFTNGTPEQITQYKFNLQLSKASPNDAATLNAIIEAYANSVNMLNPEFSNQKLVAIETQEIEGRKLEQIDFILPGQLAYALALSAIMGIGISLVIMKKELIIKRLFATPIKRKYIMLGESSGKIATGILQFVIIMSAGVMLFGYSLANGARTIVEMFIISLLGIVVFIGFGIFAASLTKSEDTITTIVNIIILPQLFLSGAFFPVEMLPSFVQPIAKLLPMTFLVESYKSVAFEGNSILEAYPLILGLIIWGVIIYVIDVKLFKWE